MRAHRRPISTITGMDDAASRAKCDGCKPHQPCPKHNAPGYATWRARHKVYA